LTFSASAGFGIGLKPIIGTRVMDSMPAQMKACPAPIAIAPAARWMACMDDPQNRLMGGARHGLRQADDHADEARNIEALLSFRKGAAQDQILDILRLHAGLFEQPLDHGCRQVVSRDLGQRALAGEMKGERT
jgi:hypothetical protein